MQGRSRILVIEDDPMFRSLVVSFLRKDYLVAVAADGKTGLDKAISHRPDLVIIDFQMPGWDGITTLKEFRRHPNFLATKFVMLTSDASKETVVSAIHAGTDDYIIKTAFNKELFCSKISKLLAPVVAKPVILNSYHQKSELTKNARIYSESTITEPNPYSNSKSVTATSTLHKDSKLETPSNSSNLTEKAKPVSTISEQEEIEFMLDDWE